MNILILNGSPRKNGATAQILRKMEKELKNQKMYLLNMLIFVS